MQNPFDHARRARGYLPQRRTPGRADHFWSKVGMASGKNRLRLRYLGLLLNNIDMHAETVRQLLSGLRGRQLQSSISEVPTMVDRCWAHVVEKWRGGAKPSRECSATCYSVKFPASTSCEIYGMDHRRAQRMGMFKRRAMRGKLAPLAVLSDRAFAHEVAAPHNAHPMDEGSHGHRIAVATLGLRPSGACPQHRQAMPRGAWAQALS